MIDPLSKLIHRNAGRHGPVMLMYHAVSPGNATPNWPWAVSMRRFCDHLDFLSEAGYSTPTMAELAAHPKDHWPARTAVITFDDGYVDNLAACDALHQRGMRATWFIVSGSVGQVPGWPADGRPQGRLLNGEELREMRELGMEIGSHTVNHVRLTQVGDTALEREVTDSKAALEDILGARVASFAYPYGDWDMRCVAAVRASGYSAACTTRTGWSLRDGDLYRLRRLTVFNTDTSGTLARKLYLGSNRADWATLAGYALRRISGK
jgi:peptidoglycan/xylan/chitin deacetylase (PgdA/CDA1 family)